MGLVIEGGHRINDIAECRTIQRRVVISRAIHSTLGPLFRHRLDSLSPVAETALRRQCVMRGSTAAVMSSEQHVNRSLSKGKVRRSDSTTTGADATRLTSDGMLFAANVTVL
jgi:hypothetical protein